MMNKKTSKKMVVIGLDGATFDIINPMIERGELPNIASFMKNGSHGPLRSTIHPTTPHAWSSFMTGKNAGKHGIFDFTEPKAGTYDVRLVNGGFRHCDSLWKMIGDAGKKVLVVNVPFTYPAEKVNGVLISGLDAPGVDGDFAHPKEIHDELVKNVGRYDLRGTFPIGKTKKWYSVDKLESVIQNRVDVTKYLMENKEWDFFMIVFGSTDHVQHMFWRYMDAKKRGEKSEDIERFGDIIEHTYRLCDQAVKDIMDAAGEDANTIIMSDHGGGSIKSIVYLNKWLESKGLLKYKDKEKGVGSAAHTATFGGIKKVRYLMKRFLPSRVKGLLKLLFPGVKDKAESFLYFSNIDWAETKAYAYGMYGNINLNLKGREPLGMVKPGKEAEDLKDMIIDDLSKLRDPSDDTLAVDKVYRGEELFSGELSKKSPDLLVAWKDYIYFSRATMEAKEDTIFGNLFNIDSSDFEYSGTHRLNGIYLGKGDDLTEGLEVKDASIVDITPTILHLMGLDVPDDMDGRVMEEVLSDKFKKDHPVSFRKGGGDSGSQSIGKEEDYSEEEEDEIKKRLHGLGYIE